MAGSTTYLTSDALARKIWSEETLYEVGAKTMVMRLAGAEGRECIRIDQTFKKQKGDSLTNNLFGQETTPFLGEGDSMFGNEQAPTHYNDAVVLTEVKTKPTIIPTNGIAAQRVPLNLKESAQRIQKDLFARNFDRLFFNNQTASPVLTHMVYSNAGTPAVTTTEATALGTSTGITAGLLRYLSMLAETGNNSQGMLTDYRFRIEPVNIRGADRYVLIVSPQVKSGMFADSEIKQDMRLCLERSADHPIFTGEVYQYHNLYICTSQFVNTASSGTIAKCLLLGKNAATLAMDGAPRPREYEYPYGEQFGMGYFQLLSCHKNVYNSQDYGTLGLYVNQTTV